MSEISGSALSVTKSLTSHNNGHKRAALDDASSDIFSMSMSGVHSHPDNNMPQNGTFVFKLTDNGARLIASRPLPATMTSSSRQSQRRWSCGYGVSPVSTRTMMAMNCR